VRPLLLQLGPLKVYGYGAMIVLGGLVTLGWLRRRRAAAGIRTDDDFWLVVNAILGGGFAGGRLLYVLEYARPGTADFWRALVSLSSGFSVLGAFVGVPLAVWGVCRWRKIPFRPLLDHLCVVAPFWHAFGRLGCFLAGCCYGLPSSAPWAVRFTDPRAQVPASLMGVPLHPAQLYEAAADVAIGVWMLKRIKRGKPTAAFYFASYGAVRVALETFRGDTVPFNSWMTAGQGLGAALILAAILCFRPS
jgi:phosphatidylglycerol:prolipoprotein diacylglycerol transferase